MLPTYDDGAKAVAKNSCRLSCSIGTMREVNVIAFVGVFVMLCMCMWEVVVWCVRCRCC